MAVSDGRRLPPRAALILFVVPCLLVMVIGGMVTAPAVASWYPMLAKPAWTPPDWLFGPVWGVLYLTMGIAAWLVWRRCGWSGARGALTLFWVQLALNALWSPLFFGLRSPLLGMIDIAALLAVLVVTTIAFWRARRLAGLLFLPYLAWVGYAAALNATIWAMN